MENVACQEIEYVLAVVDGEKRVSWGSFDTKFVCGCRNLGPVSVRRRWVRDAGWVILLEWAGRYPMIVLC